jgi:hypothetical protein
MLPFCSLPGVLLSEIDTNKEPSSDLPAHQAPEPSPLETALLASESAQLLPVLAIIHVLLAYWAVRYTGDAAYRSVIDLVLIPIHELGHALFAPLGHLLGVLGGSLTQWGLPIAITFGFWKRRDPYAVCVGLFLVGVSFHNSCQYMDSAFQMEKYPDMTFVSVGEGQAEHDWQVIFGAMKLYRGYILVAALDRLLGLALIWGSVLRGGWLLWRMAQERTAGAGR